VLFAHWLTGEKNPLTPRVLINRVWLNHFGRGLVGTPSDFGIMGEKPSHPELLDWLASEFGGQGWSMKRLHKLIMLSTVYRQSSQRDFKKAKVDPENRLYWRKPVQRLDAEVIRDSILATTGVLTPKMFGSPVPVREDIFGQIVVGIDKKEGDTKIPVEVSLGAEEFRRSIYIQVRRSQPLAMLHAFDAPVMEVNCERRQASTVATQSLMLMNSGFILQQAGKFAERLRQDAGDDFCQQISRAWQLAFARPASENEIDLSLNFLAQQIKQLQAQQEKSAPQPPDKNEKKDSKKEPPKKLDPQLQALTDFCQSLLTANEFLYVD